jgi:heme/copper-type cytochrome/quinol oxidase subunit 4
MEGVDWIHMDQDRYKRYALVNMVMIELNFIMCTSVSLWLIHTTDHLRAL